MPRTSSVDLRYAKVRLPPVRLDFTISRHSGKQASISDRLVVKPEIDLTRYAFKAVIDWIDVVVEFGRITQFQYVQDALRAAFPRICFVKAVNPGPGNTSATFSFRVQEPQSAAHVLEACKALAGKFGGSAGPLLDAIEISVDASPKVPNDEDRARLFGVMLRTIFTSRDILGPKSSRPRYSVSSGKPTFLFPAFESEERTDENWLLTENEKPVPADATFYLGARHEPAMVKLMDKVVDRQNRKAGTFADLRDGEKRVRIEVTLRRVELASLGISEVADLQRFSYASLQGGYFQFKLPTFQDVCSQEISVLAAARRAREKWRLARFLSTGIIGLMVRRHGEDRFRARHLPEMKRQFQRDGIKMRRNRRGVGPTGTMVAYAELNRLVSDALWGLARRERAVWGRMQRR
jgi:hypothetical protein